jgi:hypothetical protein
MAINSLYNGYFQKSKVFLYPILGIKKGSSVVPTQTFLSWGEEISPEDMKLVCLYTTRNDSNYINFENHFLLKHSRLADYKKVSEEETVFIFDFSDLSDDWVHFLNGHYSKINIKVKRIIKDFFQRNTNNYDYIDSYLFPDKYFENYSKILNVDSHLLKSVGELCNAPDLEKENLTIQVTNLEKIEILD